MSLERFVAAQDTIAAVSGQEERSFYELAIHEIEAGKKRTHWMWFVFPQEAGLSKSLLGYAFAIYGLEEAVAYLQHPILGRRLVRATAALGSRDPVEVFGPFDAMKYESSMELFTRAARRAR